MLLRNVTPFISSETILLRKRWPTLITSFSTQVCEYMHAGWGRDQRACCGSLKKYNSFYLNNKNFILLDQYLCSFAMQGCKVTSCLVFWPYWNHIMNWCVTLRSCVRNIQAAKPMQTCFRSI